MSIDINTNLASLIAQSNLSINNANLAKSVARLSSGLRVNSAADDAAGLAISMSLRAQVRSTNQAVRNANDGISILQIADGTAGTIGDMLTRMRELAQQSANGSIDNTNRSYLDSEFQSLKSEIDRVANVTSFGSQKLTSGANTIQLQIGINSSSNDTLDLNLSDLQTTALGVNSTDVSTSGNAAAALANVDSALAAVSKARSNYGSLQNRLDTTIQGLQVSSTNLTAADSRIRDADIAEETSNFTKNQVLVQSGVAVLAQANALPQQALSLLR